MWFRHSTPLSLSAVGLPTAIFCVCVCSSAARQTTVANPRTWPARWFLTVQIKMPNVDIFRAFKRRTAEEMSVQPLHGHWLSQIQAEREFQWNRISWKLSVWAHTVLVVATLVHTGCAYRKKKRRKVLLNAFSFYYFKHTVPFSGTVHTDAHRSYRRICGRMDTFLCAFQRLIPALYPSGSISGCSHATILMVLSCSSSSFDARFHSAAYCLCAQRQPLTKRPWYQPRVKERTGHRSQHRFALHIFLRTHILTVTLTRRYRINHLSTWYFWTKWN